MNVTDLEVGGLTSEENRSMTDNFFSNIGIKILLNEIKDKLIKKLFLDLPLDKQQEILKEIFSENKCKCNCQKDKTK
jgi:hypothetical protein